MRALYDYEAGDDDEIGFIEGDTITDVEEIDEGWLTGTVERTGQRGMAPSNYFERIWGHVCELGHCMKVTWAPLAYFARVQIGNHTSKHA